MNVVHEKHAASQPCQRRFHGRAIETPGGTQRHPFQTFEHPSFVALGLQTPKEPGARVAEALVVQIHRILCGQHYPHPKSPGLLE
ncbi:MAG: hypothetical protein BWY79_00904 [Actinobacteria bacterium ADurb.Bin444]|nr:MAG: hypothetical protein BWY79_00904 [Actinobacteria bacterium ADurb.Bin444]